MSGAEPPVLRSLTAAVRRVPLLRPWGPDVTHVHLVVVEVEDDQGHRGSGFSWTPQIGAGAVHALLSQDIAQFVVDGSTDPRVVWDRLWWHLHEAGGGGITTIAMAGLDIALWDLRARRLGQSLVDLLGRRREHVEVYGSGVNLHYTREELLEQAHRWVEAGLGGAKMKVGRPDLADDVERVAAVRQVLGPRRRLMVDANQRWDLPTARRAAAALEPYDLDWIEEPLLSDDLRAHAELRRHTRVPIALGESLYTVQQFRDAVLGGACDIVQPNVVRVGGVTPFLRIAETARALGVALAPHLLTDLSGQLAMVLPQETLVEVVESASFEDLGVLDRPSGVVVAGGLLTARTEPGHGLQMLPLSPNELR